MTNVIKFAGVFALVLGLSATAQAQELTQGTVKSIGTNEIVLKGVVKDTTYELKKDADVWLDGRASKLAEVKADDKAVVRYEKSGDRLLAQQIRALRNAKEAHGHVHSIFADKHEITLKGVVNNTTYELEKDGTVHVDTKKAKLADIRAGDEVLITYQKKGDHWMAADVTLLKRK